MGNNDHSRSFSTFVPVDSTPFKFPPSLEKKGPRTSKDFKYVVSKSDSNYFSMLSDTTCQKIVVEFMYCMHKLLTINFLAVARNNEVLGAGRLRDEKDSMENRLETFKINKVKAFERDKNLKEELDTIKKCWTYDSTQRRG